MTLEIIALVLIILAVLLVGFVLFFVIGVDKLKPIIEELVIYFEKQYTDSGMGQAKYESVMSALQSVCKEKHLPFTLFKGIADKIIESIVKHFNALK